jgi:serine/threonine protein kinase
MSSTGEYEVGVTIGEGAFGLVVHARHKASGQDVAIKLVEKVVLKKRPHVMNSIWKEQVLLRKMKDSNLVVNLWAAFHDSECVYLVLDCAFGGDLSHVIQNVIQMERERTIHIASSWQESIPHYALQLVEALRYIHAQGIIHCDLKPSNILCSRNGRIQLADFGCAVQMRDIVSVIDRGHAKNTTAECGSSHTYHNTDHRSTPIHLGTADYASPEIIQGKPDQELTTSVDLWSLGCIFYAFFHGQSPFHAASDALAVQSVMEFITQQTDGRNDDSTTHPIFLTPSHINHDDTNDCAQSILSKATIFDDWQQLIHGLLRANPADRLGWTSASFVSPLESWVWKGVDLNQDPPFAIPEASWVKASKTTPMRDGRHGWKAFLL